MPPGVGFFLQNVTSPITNTFVGSVLAPTGGSVTNSLGTTIQAIGSLTPISDTVTNTGTFDLLVAGASGLQKWDVANQKFVSFTYSAAQHTWKIGSTSTNPVIGVAEGFFLQPSAPTNWVQTLPSN